MRWIQASVHALICGMSLVGNAHLTADHVERQRNRELRDELAAAVSMNASNRRLVSCFDERVELLDPGGTEGVVEQAAQLHCSARRGR